MGSFELCCCFSSAASASFSCPTRMTYEFQHYNERCTNVPFTPSYVLFFRNEFQAPGKLVWSRTKLHSQTIILLVLLLGKRRKKWKLSIFLSIRFYVHTNYVQVERVNFSQTFERKIKKVNKNCLFCWVKFAFSSIQIMCKWNAMTLVRRSRKNLKNQWKLCVLLSQICFYINTNYVQVEQVDFGQTLKKNVNENCLFFSQICFYFFKNYVQVEQVHFGQKFRKKGRKFNENSVFCWVEFALILIKIRTSRTSLLWSNIQIKKKK